MSANSSEVERALLALDRHDRAAVIQRGLHSLDTDAEDNVGQENVDAAWLIEIQRRIDDISSGGTELLDVEDSHRKIRADISARRK
ncbi:hypothetical protein GCM10009720_28200 [Yaniella flava]|uniref:Addiction module component n=1 Tax=Yaniella flava TaxID=287930 RepID=A0ABN2UXM2_9MICC|nr:addiction module protein [Micrococcaceae bacterium]